MHLNLFPLARDFDKPQMSPSEDRRPEHIAANHIMKHMSHDNKSCVKRRRLSSDGPGSDCRQEIDGADSHMLKHRSCTNFNIDMTSQQQPHSSSPFQARLERAAGGPVSSQNGSGWVADTAHAARRHDHSFWPMTQGYSQGHVSNQVGSTSPQEAQPMHPSRPMHLSRNDSNDEMLGYPGDVEPCPDVEPLSSQNSSVLESGAAMNAADPLTSKEAMWFLDALETFHRSQMDEKDLEELVASELRSKAKHRNAILFSDDIEFMFENASSSGEEFTQEKFQRAKETGSCQTKDIRVFFLHVATRDVLHAYALSREYSPAKSCIFSALLHRVAYHLKRNGVKGVKLDEKVKGVAHKESTLFLDGYHISRSNFTKTVRQLLRKEKEETFVTGTATASEVRAQAKLNELVASSPGLVHYDPIQRIQ